MCWVTPVSKPPSYTFAQSVGFAYQGLRNLWATERHFKIHCFITVIVLALAAWLGVAVWQWCVLLITIGVMLVVEALNTAIERLVDRIDALDDSPTRGCHPLGKQAKDIAAAACLLWAVVSVGVGVLVLGPSLLSLAL